MSTSVASAVQNKVNVFQGEAHFFEDSLSPAKVKEYLARPREPDKLKGMKWLLAMVSKGRDMSDFFSDVVKNVVVRSVEVKKMVYIFLVHYADASPTCRELALLSINSFQKDLAASNQLIRALALRVMTSIRVPDIIQIQLLAVRKCASDSSPYVRKCAASAIPKIYALDRDQGPELHRIIDKLLKDGSTMVLGSAVAAFSEVCPNNYALLHPVYRKLCHLLADIDEWGQVILLNVLARYIRNQFTDPRSSAKSSQKHSTDSKELNALQTNSSKPRRRVLKKAFYSDEEDESVDEEQEVQPSYIPDNYDKISGPSASINGNENTLVASEQDIVAANLDEDHRLVLKVSLPLLKSRNSGVVMAVCALHFYCGTRSDAIDAQLSKAMVRILRSQRELQFAVLGGIRTMSAQRPYMFFPFLREFFVKAADPLFCSSIKLDILCSIACATESSAIDESNVPFWSLVLGELQSYARHRNKTFVCGSIRAAARIALAHREAYDSCLQGMMTIVMCSAAPVVIGAAVDSIRILLQQHSFGDSMDVLGNTVKTLVRELVWGLEEGGKKGLKSSAAQSCVVWLAGEYSQYIGGIAPDLLRVLAKYFKTLNFEVKMQVLGLSTKLALQLPNNESVQSLTGYILQLARFDINHDLRDRSRLLTSLLGLASPNCPADPAALIALRSQAFDIVFQAKPASLLSGSNGTNMLLGSLSSAVGYRVWGYRDLSNWSTVRANNSARNPAKSESIKPEPKADMSAKKNSEKFYESDKQFESSLGSESESKSENDSEDNTSDSTENSNESSHEGSSSGSGTSSSDYDSNSESESEESSESETETGEGIGLLNLSGSVQPASTYGILIPSEDVPIEKSPEIPLNIQNAILNMQIPTVPIKNPIVAIQNYSFSATILADQSHREVLLRHQSAGGMHVEYSYCRALPKPDPTTVLYFNFYFTNHSDSNFRHIRAIPPRDGTPFEGWGEIQVLPPGGEAKVSINIDYQGRGKAVRFEIRTDRGSNMVSITPHTGELICPVMMTAQQFSLVQKELSSISLEFEFNDLTQMDIGLRLIRSVNFALVHEELGRLLFAGMSFTAGQPEKVIAQVEIVDGKISMAVYCNNPVLPPLLLPIMRRSIETDGR